MKYILLLLVVFTLAVNAAETKKVESDVNNDGKIDRIETYKGDQLISVERDSTFSGHIDEWITYTPYVSADKPIEVTKKDTNGDGKVDRIESVYKDVKHNLLITTFEIDSKFSGKFDVKYTNTTELKQKKDDVSCVSEREFSDMKALRLSDEMKEVSKAMGAGEPVAKSGDGYVTTDMGYKVHQSCMDRWGQSGFPDLLKNGMNKGMQCLADLANKNDSAHATPNGAKINLDNLKNLLKTKGVTIICDEPSSSTNWDGVAGHASTGPSSDTLKEGTVKHPYLSLNPNDPKIKKKPTADETQEMMSTIFHEQLHNLGFKHGSGIEFPYLCETCCVSKEEAKKKEAACKVCAGAYLGSGDKRYVNDMIAYMRAYGDANLTLRAATTYVKEKPKDRSGIFALTNAMTDTFSPVGIQMAEMLKKKTPNMTAEEKKYLEEAEINQQYGSSGLKDPAVVEASKFVAKGYIGYYQDHKTKETLDEIEKNKAYYIVILKKELEATKAKDNKMYMYGNIKSQFKTLLIDIWMSEYPKKNPESDQAYKILKDLRLI